MNPAEHALPHSHDLWLVELSVAIAILASYTALDLAGRVTAARGRSRYGWLLGGAVAMGTGIWSMHFVAMLAFRLPIPVAYDVTLVVASLLAAIFASGLALYIASRPVVGLREIAAGGLVMAAAIAGMHYIGMAAMRLQAQLTYDPVLFAASIVIALGASLAALWLAFRLRAPSTRILQDLRVASALVMGVAISGMHYTGMAAAVFTPDPSLPANPPGSVAISSLGTVAIALSAFMVLGVALLLSVMSQRLARLTYTQKFIGISLLFVVPLVVTTGLFSAELSDRIDKYGHREEYGTQYLRPLQELLALVQQHQDLWTRLGAGAVTSAERLVVESQINRQFMVLAGLDAEYGALLDSTGKLGTLQAEWRTLREVVAGLGPAQRELEYARFLGDIQALTSHVGDTSYLILDPDLDTYYTMDAVLLRLPESEAQLGQILQAAGKALVSPDNTTLDAKDRATLLILAGLLRSNLSTMSENLKVAYQNDPTGYTQALIEPTFGAERDVILHFVEVAEGRLAGPVRFELTQAELTQAASRALDANRRLYDSASLALEFGLQRRIDSLTQRRYGLIGFSVIFALVPFLIGLIVMRAISRPMRQLTEATQRLAAGDMAARVMVAGQDEVGQVGASFNAMARQLEASAAALQARTRDLTLAAEVVHVLSREHDLGTLLPQAVELIRSRFDLYHVQVYLADAAGQMLILRASTGQAGQELLRRNHRLPIDLNSLNGTAAITKRNVVITDTLDNPSFRPNPLLPETRSELVAPLLVGERVIGALDLQSARPGGLSVENETVFHTLAGQLAIAIDNGTLFTQLEQARLEVEAQARRLTRTGWQEFLDAIRRRERIEQTYVQVDERDPEAAVLSAPLEVAGETVGVVTVECEAKRVWAPEEVEMTQAIARQAALQVENLRLLAQTEQYRVEAERAVRRLTHEGWQGFRKESQLAHGGYVYKDNQVAPTDAAEALAPDAVEFVVEVHGEPIGAVEVAGVEALDDASAVLVSTITDRLASHIETLRLAKQTEQRAMEMETLNQIGQALISQPDLGALLQVAGDTICRTFGADQGYIALYDQARARLEFPYYAVDGKQVTVSATTLGTGVNAMVIQKRQPLLINRDIDRQMGAFGAKTTDFSRRPKAWLGVPIVAGQQVIGLISVQSKEREDAFTEADMRLITTIAANLSTAIQNARLFAEAQKRADREALINTIGQKIQSATSVEGAVQAAARGIGEMLKVRRAIVEIGNGTPGRRQVMDTISHGDERGQ